MSDANVRLRGIASFLPEFEAPGFEFGTWTRPAPSDGVIHMPYCRLSDTASRFVETAYELGWVLQDFDWPAWCKTAEMTALRDDRAVLSRATEEQLAQLLTALIRSERFCEGAIYGTYESGLLTAILHRAEDPVFESGGSGGHR